MAVYIVTGKLGNGKTLGAVYQIFQHLQRGAPIATNLDLDITALCGKSAKTPKIFRLKDRPDVSDLEAIGTAYPKKEPYNEKKFGALVLDECGTWLNSRNWNDEGRKELIEYLLHIRKYRWNVYLIIQNINLLDKQVRESLAEHVVYMRRMDNIPVPMLSFLFSFIGVRIRLPKYHIGIVKYGCQQNSITVDTWKFRGTELYNTYDTEQVFSPNYKHGLFQLLTPWLLNRRTLSTRNRAFYMKLTKIYLKKYSRVALLSLGLTLGFLLTSVTTYSYFDSEMASLKTDMEIKLSDYKNNLNALSIDEPIESHIEPGESQDKNVSIPQIDFIDKYFMENKVRMSALMSTAKGRTTGILEFYQGSDIVEILTISQLTTYGWGIRIKDNILTVSKEHKSYYIIPTPVKRFVRPVAPQINNHDVAKR